MTGVDRDADVLGLLLPSFEGTTVPGYIERALGGGLPGVILFGHNTPDPATCREVAGAVHEIAPDALVTLDEEGGDVSRLQASTGSDLPSAWALGVVDDTSLTRRTGRALGDLLAACDVDLDLAPVLDVSTDPRNPVIGTRAFGADPDLVTRHGRAIATGLREAGVGSCGKHFPGHGATHVDSHTALPIVDLPEDVFRAQHLEPWELAPWLDAVMTAHILVPALGEGPASISSWSRRLLDEVAGNWGFRGLVITDALDMAAVSEDPGYGEAAVRAIEAGAHLLCLGTAIRRDGEAMLAEAHDAVLAAVESGRIPREMLRRRAEETRERVRTLRVRRATVGAPELPEALGALARIGADGARRAIGLRRAAITGGSVIVVDARAGHDFAAGTRRSLLAGLLRERGYIAEDARYPADLDGAGTVLVLTRLPRSDPEEREALASVLARRPDAIVVHLGVPDAAPDHPRRVQVSGRGRAMQVAAVDALIAAGHG
ncbi:glycoside hydrolase family 3 N-terminal domain-containing protein [Brachybacterium sp. AOP25-B2-12]|uniref:glycoside hydrolase family 3 N-terminal domain-containing protein n=1 Tax=Brachybacterium sp. AOP25-B2-12 TaxID=3457710 RepID=UPI004033AE43